LQGYEAKVWTADEVKTPCEGQLGSENFQEMPPRTEKSLERK